MWTAQVRATDADKGLNAQLVYSLHSAAAGSEVLQLFGVHLASGTLFLQQPALSLGTYSQTILLNLMVCNKLPKEIILSANILSDKPHKAKIKYYHVLFPNKDLDMLSNIIINEIQL